MSASVASTAPVDTFSLLNGKARLKGIRRKAAEKEEEQQRSEWKKYKQEMDFEQELVDYADKLDELEAKNFGVGEKK